jgi:hypothetical protein
VIAASAAALARSCDWLYLEGIFGEPRPETAPPIPFFQMVVDGFANLHAAGTARDS